MDGIITTSRVCKSYSVEVYRRQLRADMFVIDTGGYDVILGMTWLSKYHTVIGCQNNSMIIRISHQPEFQFVGDLKASRKKQQGDYTIIESQEKSIPVVEEF